MPSFSERFGLKPIRTSLQDSDMDANLRNGLWNVFYDQCWRSQFVSIGRRIPTDALGAFIETLWSLHFHLPIDTIPGKLELCHRKIKEQFFGATWNEVYDFIEFAAKNFPARRVGEKLAVSCNKVLERELSAFRFVGTQLTRITAKEETEAIEEALAIPRDAVKIHVATALSHLSNRKTPDYRNSIKESISAVEAILRIWPDVGKADFDKAIEKIASQIGLHGALKESFKKMYAYTSDAEGIRHALLDEPTLDFDDAKFMLVSCSAFVNYLTAKAAKRGINLKAEA